MIKIERDTVQPLGVHNPAYPCVRTSCLDRLIKYPFTHFNPPQSEFCEVLYDDCNIGIFWPTAAGKTVAMELANAKAISEGKACLNLFPLKALTEEKLMDWTDESHTFSSKKIVPITGDYILTEKKKQDLMEADIIVATSEMLDSKTRNYSANPWLSRIGLLVVDEAHLIGSESRGPRLESAILRFCQNNKDARIVIMSATVPNRVELCEWIENITGKNTKIIESAYRPCVLNKTFVRFDDAGSANSRRYEQLEILRMKACYAQILKNPNDQHLVFTGPKVWGYKFKDFLIKHGIEAEFHNADLPKEKRREIENKFRTGEIHILISTSTLSWGCHEINSEILMENGTHKDVGSVKAGDYVLSYNKNDNKFYSRKVLKSKRFKLNKSLKIKVLKKHSLECHVSEDHLFLNAQNVWVEAKELKNNDYIKIYTNSYYDEFKYGLAKVYSIEECDGGEFQEIEVEDLHNYVCDGFISHNCNLPARRVILAHTTYGVSPMEICDIEQAWGRSGRPKYDKQGDAYTIIPKSQYDNEVKRIQQGFQVCSFIHEIPNLAFHAVSEIASESIKTKNCFRLWYEKTLAYIQGYRLSEEDCDNVFELLENKKMIKKHISSSGEEIYEVTALGKICSDMYMNPFDVYDWFVNFCYVEKINTSLSDSTMETRNINKAVAMALASCYEYQKNKQYCSKSERETFNVRKFMELVGGKPDGVKKVAACYYAMLNGDSIDLPLRSTSENLKIDLQRVLATIKLIHKRYGSFLNETIGYKYDNKEWDALYFRIIYGVTKDLVSLVTIPGIGREYSRRLFDKNIKNIDSFIKNRSSAIEVLGEKKYENILSQIKK